MKLELLRKKINAFDLKIINLLAKRKNLVNKIALIKRTNNIAIPDFKRETELLERLIINAEASGLEKKFILKVFALIIKESRRIQEKGN